MHRGLFRAPFRKVLVHVPEQQRDLTLPVGDADKAGSREGFRGLLRSPAVRSAPSNLGATPWLPYGHELG